MHASRMVQALALLLAGLVPQAMVYAQAAAPLIAHLRAYVLGLLPLQPGTPTPRRRPKS